MCLRVLGERRAFKSPRLAVSFATNLILGCLMTDRLSNFNAVLEQVLNLTQATYDEFAAAQEGTVKQRGGWANRA